MERDEEKFAQAVKTLIEKCLYGYYKPKDQTLHREAAIIEIEVDVRAARWDDLVVCSCP